MPLVINFRNITAALRASFRVKHAFAFRFTFILFTACAYAQSGTYEKKNSNGSYCYISIHKSGAHLKAEIFAWWNTPSAQTGSYYGEGVLDNGKCKLKSDENDPGCKVILAIKAQDNIVASFKDCATDHLTEDFNGRYVKITNAVAGDYIVAAGKSYFHKKPDPSTRLKTYVLKGDKVTLSLDSVIPGNWVNAYYVDAKGKETRGYINLNDLKRAD